MKSLNQFLKLFLFSLMMYPIMGYSQCDPTFKLKMEDFNCGIGSLCLVFDVDANVNCWNEDLSIQIEYNTPGFIVTNSGEYIKDPVSDNTTTWYNMPFIDWGSDPIYLEYCFEGTIQIPGTTLTLRIIDNATGNVLFSQVVNPVITTTIGNGGTILLSSILGTQLLDRATAATTAQRVVIDGILIVDRNYGFGTNTSGAIEENQLLFTPNSGIVVNPGYNLTFDHALLSSCDAIWQGISLGNQGSSGASLEFDHVLIKNAEKAAQGSPNSMVTLLYTNIHNCEYGVYADFSAPDAFNLSIFTTSSPLGGRHRVEFTADQNSLFSYHEGVHLKNVTNTTQIGGWINFKDLTQGIYAYNSDLIVGFNGGQSPGFTGLNTGISSSNSDLLEVQAFFTECSSYGVIFSANKTSRIHHSEFFGCGNSIFCKTRNPDENVVIEFNDIFASSTGISGAIRPSRGEIQFNNQIRTSGGSINLFGLGAGNHIWATQHNDWIKSDNSFNVRYRRTNFARIYENDLSEATSLNNFHVHGGQQNLVGCNDVVSNTSGHNIFLSGSPMSQVYCNEALSSSSASNLLVSSINGQSTIRNNTMTSGTFNLQYGDINNSMALSGPQEFHANLFDFSSSTSPKAIHYGTTFEAQNSYYWVEFTSSQGFTEFPYFTSAYNDWFSKDFAGNSTQCGNCTVGLPGGVPEIDHVDNAQVIFDYIQNGFEINHGDEAKFDAELKLWRSLLIVAEDGTLSGDLLTYYNANIGSEPYHFAYIDKQLSDAVNLSDSDVVLLRDLDEDLTLELDQYNQIQWYVYDENSGSLTIDSTKVDERDSLKLLVENIQQQISVIVSPYITAWQGELSSMITYNNGISTATTSGSNLKSINAIYLPLALNGKVELTSNEATTINTIAEQCVLEGGEAVLSARNLEAMHLGLPTNYSDICNQAISGPSNQKVPESYLMNISPNPGQSQIQVNLDEILDIDAVVVDIAGRTIWEGKVIGGKVLISTNTWKKGVYFIKTIDKKYQGKIIIE